MGRSWFVRRRLVKGEYYWFAVERASVDGKRRERTHSLGVTGRHAKRAAQAAFNAWMQGSATVDTPSAATSMCREYFAAYLEQVRPSVRPNTFLSYSMWLGRAGEFWSDLSLRDLRMAHIEAWKAHLMTKYKPSSVNMALRNVKAVLGTAVTQEILLQNPMKGMKMVYVPRKTFDPYITMDQFLHVVLPNTSFMRHQVVFSLAMFAGLRRGEIVHLRWRDVDVKNRVIRIESTDDFQTKSGHGRLIPLYPELETVLTTWKAAQSRPLPTNDSYVVSGTKVPANDCRLSRAWTALVPTYRSVDPSFPPIVLHGLRHSFATHLAMSGLNLHTLKSILGHADIQTTMIYAHVEPSRALDLARAITLS